VSLKSLQDGLGDFRVLGQSFEGLAREAAGGSPLHERFLVRHNNTDKGGLKRVTVDEGLSNDFVLSVDDFDLFGGNVFTLSQLEDVLDTVNNLQATLGVPFTNVTSVAPAVLVQDFGSLFGGLVVAREDTGTTDADFTTGVGLVLRGVAHRGNVDELDFNTRDGGTDVTRSEVLTVSLRNIGM
jgi:hypothetical protein